MIRAFRPPVDGPGPDPLPVGRLEREITSITDFSGRLAHDFRQLAERDRVERHARRMAFGEAVGALVDLVLPGDCAGCGAPDPPWCPRCVSQLGPPSRPRVPGVPEVLAAGRYHGPLRAALLRYKERGRRDLAAPLAELLAAALPELGIPAAEPTWLLPAPSHPVAARVRGGDHVLRLCRSLAARHDGLRVARPLRLARQARDSVGLDAAQRAANLSGRLRVRAAGAPPPGVPVVLVDDVVTTGATLRACRSTLAAAGLPVHAALVLCDATGRAG